MSVEELRQIGVNIFIMGEINVEQGSKFYQNVENNSGTMNMAEGNISSVNTVNGEKCVDTINKINNLLNKLDISYEQKESAQDDLDIIREQVASKEPKAIKIKKAFNGIKTLIFGLPKTLGVVNEILPEVEELSRQLGDFIS